MTKKIWMKKSQGKLSSGRSTTDKASQTPVFDPFNTIIGQQTWTTGDVISFNIPDYVDDDTPTGYTIYRIDDASPNQLSEITLVLSEAGLITGTIGDLKGGTYNFIFRATNIKGDATSSLTITLVGLEVVAPTFAGIPDQNDWKVDQFVDLDFSQYMTEDGDPAGTETVTYLETTDVLTGVGLLFNSFTAELRGVMLNTQTITNVTIEATNESGLSTPATFPLTVGAADAGAETPEVVGWYSGNTSCTAIVAPTWIAGGDTFFIERNDTAAKSIDVIGLYLASNGGEAISSVAITGSLPAGLSFNTTTGFITGALTGTPQAVTTFDVTFTASNPTAGASDSSPTFTFDIYDNAATAPSVSSIDAVEGDGIVYVNYTEPMTSPTSDYDTGASLKLNNSAVTNLAYASGFGANRHKYTFDESLTGNNTLEWSYTNTTGDITGDTSGLELADVTDLSFVVPTASEGVFASEDFNSGSLLNPAGELIWKSDSGDVTVSTENPQTGSHSLRFRFPAAGSNGRSGTVEQRFSFSSPHKEYWVKHGLYIPSNYQSGNPLATDVYKKFYFTWGDHHGAGSQGYEETDGVKMGHHFSNNNVVSPVLDNVNSYARAYIEGTRTSDMGHSVTNTTGSKHFEGLVSDNDRGHWMTVVRHYKYASVANNDGVLEVWKTDWEGITTKSVNIQDGSFYGTMWDSPYGDAPGFNAGYFLGSADSGYPEETILYIDNVVFSTTALI